MTLRIVLFLSSCSILISTAGGAPVSAAPLPREMPMLKCELSVTGKIDGTLIPDGGVVVITNISGGVVDIGATLGPKAYLDLKVRDSKGLDVKTDPLASLISPTSPFPVAQPHELKPGETYLAPLSLLVMVPEEKRIPGTYKVKAVFTYKKKEYESAEVEVKWPEIKK